MFILYLRIIFKELHVYKLLYIVYFSLEKNKESLCYIPRILGSSLFDAFWEHVCIFKLF